ncbi:MAG: tetratricopeptide repeat protein [Stenotrophobium sp.]
MRFLPLLITTALAIPAALLPAGALASESYVAGSSSDPYLHESQYLADDGRNFSALIELLGTSAGNVASQPEEYQWQLAETYLSFGMAAKAAPIFARLATKTSDHQRLAKARLRLAEFYYDRGYLDQAATTLALAKTKLPQSMFPKWQDLTSRVQLAQGNYAGAVETLSHPESSARDQSAYTRFNLGIALINTGHVAQGRDIIDRVGRMRVETLDDLALRDKANLTLGWNFLHDQLGGSAKGVLERVRSKGPFSNRALLGVGWAELMQRGERQRHVDIDSDKDNPFSNISTLGVLLRPGFLDRDVLMRSGLNDFKLSGISSDKQKSFKRALSAWVELIHRDPMDPAVEEGWLAIPYSLDRLGAHTEAVQYYELAIKKLEISRQNANQAMASIRQGRMVDTIVRRDSDAESGWQWSLHDLPDAPETYYLQNLIADHPFQEALKNYRDVRLMSRNLDSWKQRLDALEKTYLNENREPVDPEILFRRATAGWTRPWPTPSIQLHPENSLAAPGSYDTEPHLVTAPVDLTLAPAPADFDGELQRIHALQARATALQPILADLDKQQSKLLQDMAVKELDGQKTAIEKYLLEARFSLARLYDRQMKGQLHDK